MPSTLIKTTRRALALSTNIHKGPVEISSKSSYTNSCNNKPYYHSIKVRYSDHYRYASGQNHLTDFIGMEPSKKRKRRTSFTPQALELLNAHFERNTHPSGEFNRFEMLMKQNGTVLCVKECRLASKRC